VRDEPDEHPARTGRTGTTGRIKKMADMANVPKFKRGDLVERDGILYWVMAVHDTDQGHVLAVSVQHDPNYPDVPGVFIYEDENGEEAAQYASSIAWFRATDDVHLVRDLDHYYRQVGIERAPLTPEEEQELEEKVRKMEEEIRKIGDLLIEEIDSTN
jgi:hypothetical protein